MLICRTKLRKKLLQTQRFSKFSLGTLFLGVSSVFFQFFLCGQSVENSLFSPLTLCLFCAVLYASCYPLSKVRGATQKSSTSKGTEPEQMETFFEVVKKLLMLLPLVVLSWLVLFVLFEEFRSIRRERKLEEELNKKDHEKNIKG